MKELFFEESNFTLSFPERFVSCGLALLILKKLICDSSNVSYLKAEKVID